MSTALEICLQGHETVIAFHKNGKTAIWIHSTGKPKLYTIIIIKRTGCGTFCLLLKQEDSWSTNVFSMRKPDSESIREGHYMEELQYPDS